MSTKHTIQHSSLDEAWRKFQHEFQLSNDQIQKFKRYAQLLIDWNDKFNITTITDVYSIIDDHFKDSITLSRYINVSTMRGLADIGSGGGFLPRIKRMLKMSNYIRWEQSNDGIFSFSKSRLDRICCSISFANQKRR